MEPRVTAAAALATLIAATAASGRWQMGMFRIVVHVVTAIAVTVAAQQHYLSDILAAVARVDLLQYFTKVHGGSTYCRMLISSLYSANYSTIRGV
eukprot:14795-Heterococcus_DN1.PRE.4